MRDFSFDELTSKDLIDHAVISEEFKKYLMEVLEYDEGEADFVVSNDFENPYDSPFIMQDYDGIVTIDGKDYEARYCYTDFCACGLFHLAEKPPFDFYMLFDCDTLPDESVGSYLAARKMYLI